MTVVRKAQPDLLKWTMPDDLRAAVRVIASGDGLLAQCCSHLIEDFASRTEQLRPGRP